MTYRGSDDTMCQILTDLLSETEPRDMRGDKVILPVMRLEDLVDDDGELRRVGTEMLTGSSDDVRLLRLLVRIAIISPPCESDATIYKEAVHLEDDDSMAWIYACGIGTEKDDVKAIRLFRSDPELSALYSGVWSSYGLLEKHSFIRNRIDSIDGPVIGVCPVGKAHGKQSWTQVKTKVSNVDGKHDLYLIFKGEGENLFDFDSWRFTAK